MDALLIHSVLSDDDIFQLLGIQRKDLRALCAKLKEDHLVVDHIQRVDGPNQRQISKTYYYIHYTEAIDAIKWKVHSMVNKLKEDMGNEAVTQGYICDQCGSRYSTIDAVTNFSPERNGFVCELCGNLLHEDDTSAQSKANQERLGILMSQIQPIIDALKQIDEVMIPENTFQSALAIALPVPSSQNVNGIPRIYTEVNGKSSIKIAAGSSTPNTTTSINGGGVQVNITSDKETVELEKQQREEKARLAEENALPAWHLESTVGKSLFESASEVGSGIKLEQDEIKQEEKQPEPMKVEEPEEDNSSTADEDALAVYYAQLAQQQKEDDEEEEEEEEDEEEEDEGVEFEDVTNEVEIGDLEEDDDEDEEV